MLKIPAFLETRLFSILSPYCPLLLLSFIWVPPPMARILLLLLMDSLFCCFLNSVFLSKLKGLYFMLILFGLSAAFKLCLSELSFPLQDLHSAELHPSS